MSWLFGFYSKEKTDTRIVAEFHPSEIESYSNNKIYIAIGGNHQTAFYEKKKTGLKYFICGVPISADPPRILSNEDLNVFMNSTPYSTENINGHFCGICVENETLSFFTDKLGLREIFIFENKIGWYFSTRLDWLLQLDHFEIDYSEFGSRWLLANQLSNRSIVSNIHRLNCGSKASIVLNKLDITNNNWIPSKKDKIGINEFSENLQNIILLGEKDNSNISLSLSGGMDSRVILSYLLNSTYENYDCHTFNNDEDIDSDIAGKISNDHNIKCNIISNSHQTQDDIISELIEYVGSTYLTESGYTSQKLMNYRSLPKDSLIIDGGFGEIWRREFLTRLYYFGKDDLTNRNYKNITGYLLNQRANIFNENYNSRMQNGIYNQIEELLNYLPPIREVGLENWLDLFSLKTRLVNYYAPEQSRIDSYVKSYMPFVQTSLLDNLLALPANIRKNNRLFKKIIKSNYSELAKYNLSKGDLQYPFWFTPLMKRVYSQIFDKFRSPRDNQSIHIYLNKLKEFTLDTISSNSVKEYSPYNYNQIKIKVDSYYNGNLSEGKFVDWFITFEIFRQIIGSKHTIFNNLKS